MQHEDPLGAIGDLTVVVATELEARPVRRLVPQIRVVRVGMGVTAGTAPARGVVLSVGVAGGLDPATETGTIVIPQRIDLPDGTSYAADIEWSRRLRDAARRLTFPVDESPLITTPYIVRGAERAEWAARGYRAVDMESAVVAAAAPRCAAVRVVLDTPLREISDVWVHPARAMLNPRNWAEGQWLYREGRRCATRAALVLQEVLRSGR